MEGIIRKKKTNHIEEQVEKKIIYSNFQQAIKVADYQIIAVIYYCIKRTQVDKQLTNEATE